MVSVACPRPGGDAGVGPLLPLCVTLVGLLLAPDPAAAQDTPYFDDVTATHVPTDTTAHLLDIDLGDVDGDGDLDAVAAHEYGVNRLYVNDGTGRFSWPGDTFTDVEHDNEEVELTDLNGDGALDVVFIAEDDGGHELYLGHGDGTFRDVSDRLPARTVANDVETADVNDDGVPDLVVSNTGASDPGEDPPEWQTVRQNFLWLDDPDRPGHVVDATAERMPAVQDASQDTKLGDLDGDGDGDPDLILCAVQIPGFHPLQVRAYRNDGTGRFTDVTGTVMPAETRGRGWDVETGDVNGDGRPDVFIGGWDTQVRLLLGRGGPSD